MLLSTVKSFISPVFVFQIPSQTRWPGECCHERSMCGVVFADVTGLMEGFIWST